MQRSERSDTTLIYSVLFAIVALLAGIAVWKRNPTHQVADMVIINSRVWTGDSFTPYVEAFAVSNNKIIAVGSSSEMMNFMDSNTKVFDGKKDGFEFVVPGFHDCHIHVMDGGYALSSVQLRDAKDKQEFRKLIQEFVSTIPEGRWVREGWWNHENWGGVLPDHTWIDDITPKNPIWVCRLDGHMCLANALTLSIANITKDTPEVPGGTIVRDSEGNPTGILKDNAMDLINSIAPKRTTQEDDEALEAALKYIASHGVTSIHHMGEFSHLDVFERAHKQQKLTSRIYAAEWSLLVEKIKVYGRGDEWLKIGNLKAFADGSLGSHTAWMVEPYTDLENDTGLVLTKEENMRQWIKEADAAGLHVSVHAIGDRATHLLLDIFEDTTALNGPKDRRFRMEHAQQIQKKDLHRFRKNNIIASMQPYHAIDDGSWAERLLGSSRIKDAYPFRSLLNNGAMLIFGSDWFVAPPVPLIGIYAAVTRRTLDGKNPGGWIPEEKITVEEALRAYTLNAAYASFEENIKGQIREGFLADFVMLDKDLTRIPAVEIQHAKVVATVVGGKVVYNAQ